MSEGGVIESGRRRGVVVEAAGVEYERKIGGGEASHVGGEVVHRQAIFDGFERAGGVDEEGAEEVLNEGVAGGGEFVALELVGELDCGERRTEREGEEE
jgi:hypothetical protein